MRCTEICHFYMAYIRGNIESTLVEKRAVIRYQFKNGKTGFYFELTSK